MLISGAKTWYAGTDPGGVGAIKAAGVILIVTGKVCWEARAKTGLRFANLAVRVAVYSAKALLMSALLEHLTRMTLVKES